MCRMRRRQIWLRNLDSCCLATSNFPETTKLKFFRIVSNHVAVLTPGDVAILFEQFACILQVFVAQVSVLEPNYLRTKKREVDHFYDLRIKSLSVYLNDVDPFAVEEFFIDAGHRDTCNGLLLYFVIFGPKFLQMFTIK